MPESPTPRRSLGGLLCAAILGGVIAALLLVSVPGASRDGHAAPTRSVDVLYLYITGEGATAKAWYDGVASAGVPVQDALDKYAAQGYTVSRVTDNLRSTEDNVAFAILLQRIR